MKSFHVFGGLCNRLRAILSLRHAHGPITVAWVPDGEIANERFLDVFEPLDGVTFVDAPEPGWPKTLDVHSLGWERAWLEVRMRDGEGDGPVHWVSHAPYAAMHIRRTDCVFMQHRDQTYRTEAEYLAFAEGRPERRVFVATDNGTTQRLMTRALEAIGKEVVCVGGIPEVLDQDLSGHRNTTLRHAWCDILACVGASAFMGSGSSSFTTTIETMRRLTR